MVRRLVRDETGVALPLAVIMVVLVGVMGAGLLVFVNSNLEAVVESNQGQRAFDAADAGIQAAKRELRRDADPGHYDAAADCANNSGWAYKTMQGGVCKDNVRLLNFGGSKIRVSIQYLPPAAYPDSPTPDQAPEVIPEGQTMLSSGCNYFKVRSYGLSGPARRGVEAIFCASPLNIPTAYYTPKDIEFDGNVTVSGVSFFAQGNIIGSNSGSVEIKRNPPTSNPPALYGDWDTENFKPPSKHNTVGRKNSANQPAIGAGLAAEGVICNRNDCSRSAADGYHDYDSTTGTRGQNLRFVRKSDTSVDNAAGTISYPFDPSAELDLDLLREEADRNGTYYPARTNLDNAQVPADSDERTVIYVDAQGGDVDYRASYNPKAQGIIVVENGNLTINNSSTGFKGIIIITGDGTTTGRYKSSGNDTVEGFVIADGKMTIRGTVAPLAVTEDFTNRPGFYGVELWSWRELYE